MLHSSGFSMLINVKNYCTCSSWRVSWLQKINMYSILLFFPNHEMLVIFLGIIWWWWCFPKGSGSENLIWGLQLNFVLQNNTRQCNRNRMQRNVTSWKMFSYSVTFYMNVSKLQWEAVQKEIERKCIGGLDFTYFFKKIMLPL